MTNPTRFASTEARSAGLLLAATAAALLWANSPWSASYQGLWATEVGASVGDPDDHLRVQLHLAQQVTPGRRLVGPVEDRVGVGEGQVEHDVGRVHVAFAREGANGAPDDG